SYLGGNVMEPMLISLLGLASIYSLGLLEGQSRRDFRAGSTTVESLSQVESESSKASDERSKSNIPQPAESCDTFQDHLDQLQMSPPRRRPWRARSADIPRQGPTSVAIKKFQSDFAEHRCEEHEAPELPGAVEAAPQGRGKDTKRLSEVSISVSVVPNEISGSWNNSSSQSQSQLVSASSFRIQIDSLPTPNANAAQWSMTSSEFFTRSRAMARPDNGTGSTDARRRLGVGSGRDSLCVSKSSDESPGGSGGSYPDVLKEVATVACQTELLWKDEGWHCTRCSKPPAAPKAESTSTSPSPASPVSLSARPRNRQNAKSQHQVEAWKKAMERMVQMQGTWRLVYGPENVSPWLEQFMICGTCVRCEDSDRSLELVETVHPALGGGMLMLDKDNMLHRFGKTGQHLMFERFDVSDLNDLVNRVSEENDIPWFSGGRAQSGEIRFNPVEDVLDDLEMQ
ncbi:unnamed protein product, partial [Durusdinium trenchii]